MKRSTGLLFTMGLILCSCSSQPEIDLGMGDSTEVHMKSMSISLDETSLLAFATNNITELGVYVYLNDSLVYGKNLPINNGDLSIEVPLGENLQTFAVANADRIEDTEWLSTVTIYQDLQNQKEIFLSEIKTFLSDRTVSAVNLDLRRMVGQIVFQPLENIEDLASLSQFDELSVIFNTVVSGYMPGRDSLRLDTIAISTSYFNDFKASIYSFPSPAESLASIEVIYLKDGAAVNQTLRPLEAAINIEASKRTIVNMPILDDNYLEKSFTASPKLKSANIQELIIQEIEF